MPPAVAPIVFDIDSDAPVGSSGSVPTSSKRGVSPSKTKASSNDAKAGKRKVVDIEDSSDDEVERNRRREVKRGKRKAQMPPPQIVKPARESAVIDVDSDTDKAIEPPVYISSSKSPPSLLLDGYLSPSAYLDSDARLAAQLEAEEEQAEIERTSSESRASYQPNASTSRLNTCVDGFVSPADHYDADAKLAAQLLAEDQDSEVARREQEEADALYAKATYDAEELAVRKAAEARDKGEKEKIIAFQVTMDAEGKTIEGDEDGDNLAQ